MKEIKQHIIIKIIALTLVIAIAIPLAVKLAHVFENHKHEVCNDTSSSHFHQKDIECEIYNFHLKPNIYPITTNFNLLETNFFFKLRIYSYNFHSNHQQNSTYLRGPPYS